MSQTETQAIAVEEELSQPCTIRKFPDVTGMTLKERVDTLVSEYARALSVIGKCELQRQEALDATKKLKKTFND